MDSNQSKPPNKTEYMRQLMRDFQAWAQQTNPSQLAYNEARVETMNLLARAQTDTQEVKT